MKNQKLLDWVLEKIRTEYKDDISLLIGYDADMLDGPAAGEPYQYLKGPFDYFVPATKRGYELGRTFIIDDIGYDLYARGWEWIEDMPQLNDYNLNTLGEGTILYSRSEADTLRFEAARERLRQNLANPSFVYGKALGQLDTAMGIYASLAFTQSLGEARMQAGLIIDGLARAVAFVNGRYFMHGVANQLAELAAMPKTPDGFAALYNSVIKAEDIETLRRTCHDMLALVRAFLRDNHPAPQPAPAPDFAGLASWYEELSYTWLRINRQCQNGNAQRAFMWSVFLQTELDIVAQEFGLEKMDLLSAYDAENLGRLWERAEQLEESICDTLAAHGAAVHEYDDIDAFLREN